MATPSAEEENFARLKKRFPGLTDAQYASLDSWYTDYAALILRMYEEITSDPEAYAHFVALTDRPSRSDITGPLDTARQNDKS
jgi:hypothetical protein